MGVILTENQDGRLYNVNSYIADTLADLEDLPKKARPGSTCLIIDTSDVYMLNTEGEWKKL